MFDLDNKIVGEGLTYDDVLLVPAFSEVLPRDVDISSRFSRNIEVKTPIVSAAMDTVTESALAIALAQEGGIGVLHKNMSIEAQAAEVRKVKRSESGMIQDPVTLHKESTVGDALALMREHSIGGIPVINDEMDLMGIITNRDLRFEKDKLRPVEEVMTRENIITIQEGFDYSNAEEILQEYKIEKLPVVNKENKLRGLITFKDIVKAKIKPHACKDEFGRLRVAAAVGITEDMLDRIGALVENSVDAVVIDTAHGHTKGVIDALKATKSKFSGIDIVVGNVGTAAAATMLVDNGADAVKVGIGPGSICTTRVIAGVGMPQLSAVMEVYKALKSTDVPLIADGGIRFSGDIVKALAAGGSTIMAGGMFAGVEESPGETILYEGRKFKSYRGMGSVEAMQQGSKDRYFQDTEDDIKKLVPEGISGRKPYKGNLSEVLFQQIGGLRAGMGYCGAHNIEALRSAQFVKITAAGVAESHPHNVAITREAPNYSR